MKEIVVIGAGIIGSFLAHELIHYQVHVTLIEKRHDICEEVSSANSAIIHAGYDPVDRTLKARLNKLGADKYPLICKQLQVAYKRVGAVVVACGEQEEKELEILYQRGLQRGIAVHYVDVNDLRKKEPHIAQGITKAMEASDTAIITPWEVGNALVDEFLLNGGTLKLDENVMNLKVQGEQVEVITNKGSYKADMVINAAGLGAQRIMEMVETETLFEIQAKRGEYFVLSTQVKDFVHQVIYPTPTKAGKGVLAVPTIHGNILLGPNSEEIENVDSSNTAMGLEEVKVKLAKILCDVPYQEVIHTYSGVRPCGNHGDFFIDFSRKTKHIVHLGCIDSPGLASAPAIAEYVMKEFVLRELFLQRKASFVHRQKNVCMRECNLEEKKQYILQEALYGHIVCRCEQISEQEIIDCIHRPCGARSVKGVKKRVRPGMGKCQGGFCEVEVAKILARELQIPLSDVCFDEDSYYTLSKEG